MKVLEKTKPRLIAEARDMREQGSSFDDIAAHLTQRLGLKIGRETVRRWFLNQQ